MAILAIVLLGALILHGQLDKIERDQATRSQIDEMLDELSPSIARSTWQVNSESVQVFLNTIVSRDEILAASFQDSILDLDAGDVKLLEISSNECDEIIIRDFAGFEIEGNVLDQGLLKLCFQIPSFLPSTEDVFKLSDLPFLLAIIATSMIFVIFNWSLVISPLRKLSVHISEHRPIEEFKRDVFFGFDNEKDELDTLIGELVKRTQELAEERALVNASFPEIVDAIVQTNKEHKIQRYNHALERMIDMTSPLIGFDLSKKIPKEALEDIDSNKELYTIQDRILEISTTKMTRNDTTIGYLHVLRDLTQVKKLQDKAMHASKLAALGTMSGGIAHDYNNLLATVLSNAELLSQNTDLSPSGRQALKSIIEATARGSSLSKQLLDFAQNRKPNFEYTKISEVLEIMHDMCQSMLPEGIDFSTKLEVEDQYVFADLGGLKNALLNLIINARDALKGKGKIELIAKASEQFGRDSVDFVVADNGPGIEPENLEKIRDPFFTTKPKGKGAGLGLAMVTNFSEQNNGFFSIESEFGCGAQMIISLPVVNTPKEAKTPAAKIEKDKYDGGKILLIEDEKSLCQVLSSFLEGDGHDISSATSLEEVKNNKFAQVKYDLVICDVLLHSSSVLDVYDLFQKSENSSPFFVISGNVPDSMATLIADIEPVQILEKPFRAGELLEEVRKALKLVRSREKYN